MTNETPIIRSRRFGKDHALERIFLDFLKGDRSARLGEFMYQDILTGIDVPQGAGVEGWDNILGKESPYYIFPNEVDLIARAATEIAEAAPYRATLIELGVGSRKSIEQKTLPLINAMRPQLFVANDLSRDAVAVAQEAVVEALPFLKVEGSHSNFLTPDADVYNHPAANVIMTGSTVSNISSYDGNVPVNEVVAFLRTIGRLVGAEGSLIITQDTNQDAQSLRASYSAPEVKQCLHDTVHRARAYLDVSSLDVDALRHEPVWEERSGLLVNTFVNLKDQTVIMRGERIHMPAGHRMYIANCYKYKKNAFLHMCHLAGFDVVNTWMDAADRVALHVLKKRT